MRSPAPVQQLSMTANLVIFLGILYTLLHLLAWLGTPTLTRGGYGLPGLGLALSIIGLGYGIRYGSSACLYAALAIFVSVGLYYATVFVTARSVFSGFRLVLSLWACWRLQRAIPLMHVLQQEHAFPLPMSSYGALWWRRLRGILR